MRNKKKVATRKASFWFLNIACCIGSCLFCHFYQGHSWNHSLFIGLAVFVSFILFCCAELILAWLFVDRRLTLKQVYMIFSGTDEWCNN